MTTERIANFIMGTTYEQLPQQAITNAKSAVLDCVGVMLGGSREHSGIIVSEYVKGLAGKAEASVICGHFRAPAPHAAFANGTMAHALDYDDYILDIALHPSVSVLPAVLALGEADEISGKEALLAYIVGREVESKLARVIGSKHYELGWHTTPIVGVLGAAATAAKILKLDKQQTKITLGLAASQAGGMRGNFGTDAKPFHPGNAAKSGVIAAQLAQRGLTASSNIIEGDLGFLRILGGNGSRDLANALGDLGSPLDIVAGGVNIKRYPSCAYGYGAMDAILYLVEQHNVDPEEVAEVVCEVSSVIPQQLMVYRQPQTSLQAKYSLEYCLAIACLDRKASLKQFTDERVIDSRAQDYLSKIKVIPVEGAPSIREAMEIPQKVTVKLNNGEQYYCQVDIPKGDHRNPMSDEEIAVKYKDCAQLVLQAEKIDESLMRLQNLEVLPNIAELMNIIR